MTTQAQSIAPIEIAKKPRKRNKKRMQEHKKKLKMARQWIEDLGGDANEFETVMNDILD